MSSGKDPKIAEMGKEVFLAMESPQVFAISMFKVAFKVAAHKRDIWHDSNREGYNYHFRATMREVKKLVATEKKHGQLCLF